MAASVKPDFQRYRKYYQSIEPLMKKPETKRYTSVVFSFLAVSLFAWYAIRPTVQTILYLRREISDNIVVNQKMEEKIMALIEGQANYQQAEESIPIIAQSIPDSPELISFVAQVRTLSRLRHIALLTITIPPAPLFGPTATGSAGRKTETKLAELPVSFAVTGLYTDVKGFLDDAAGMRRIATIDEIALVPSKGEALASPSGEPQTGLVQLAVKGKIYYLGQ